MTKTAEISSEDTKYAKRQLLDNWRIVKLGDVCRVVGGSTPSSGVPQYWDGDIVWITPTDLGKLENELIITSERKITRVGYENCGTELIPIGSVILSSRAPIGYLGIATVPLCTNQGCKSFVPSSEIDTQYLFYALKISVPELQSLGSGATFKEISKTELERFEIPLPPFSDQKRIAKILQEQMMAVEQARRNAEEQLQAAEALPNSYLRIVFSSSQTQAWPRKRFGDICEFIGGSQPSKGTFKYEHLPGYVRLVQIQDFRRDDAAVYIREEDTTRRFDESDVMIGRYGPPVFQIFRGLSGAYNVALMKTAPIEELSKDYLFYLLQEPSIQNAVISQSRRAAGQSGVPKDFLEELIVPLPSFDDQRRIAKQLSEQMTSAERLRRTLTEQLYAINKIPTALLRRAFSREI